MKKNSSSISESKNVFNKVIDENILFIDKIFYKLYFNFYNKTTQF